MNNKYKFLQSLALAACLSQQDIDCLANAIFRAEGTHSKHPYGVMIPCTHPRVVCINTINHAWIDFERQQEQRETYEIWYAYVEAYKKAK